MDDRARIQIRQRLDALAWFRDVQRQHPGGIVPVSVAARILSVSGSRVRFLQRSGRLTRISGLPGGSSRDVFVSLDELLMAPFVAEVGGRGQFARVNTGRAKIFFEPRKAPRTARKSAISKALPPSHPRFT